MDKEYKNFIVGKILKVEQTKSITAKANLVEGNIPYVTRTVSDNGYMGTCGNVEKVNKGNCITIGAETGVAFYQPEDFVAGNKVYRLSADELNENHYLFLAGALNRLTQNYSYSNARIPEKIKKESILLPIKTDENNDPIIDNTHFYHDEGFIPDFEYMEFRIAELEKERIAELENYLIVTGLNDYTLTDEDKEILKTQLSDGGGYKQNSTSGNGCLKETKQFKISDLFIVEGTKSLNAGDLKFKNNGINFIGRTGDNNGIQGKIDRQSFEPNKAGTLTVTVIGNYKYVKYQENPYYCSQNINKLTPIFDMTPLLSLYFICPIQNFVNLYNGKQSGYKLDELKNHVFELPIQTDDNNNPIIDENNTYHPDGYIPDFDYMEKYIKVIEKLIIKDVVDYKDTMIAETKKCLTN